MNKQEEEPHEEVTLIIPTSMKDWYEKKAEQIGMSPEDLMSLALSNEQRRVEYRPPKPYNRNTDPHRGGECRPVI